LDPCPNSAPIERYDRFFHEWKKIAKMVFWKGVLISMNKPIL
jgi:hypothetical protein